MESGHQSFQILSTESVGSRHDRLVANCVHTADATQLDQISIQYAKTCDREPQSSLTVCRTIEPMARRRSILDRKPRESSESVQQVILQNY